MANTLLHYFSFLCRVITKMMAHICNLPKPTKIKRKRKKKVKKKVKNTAIKEISCLEIIVI